VTATYPPEARVVWISPGGSVYPGTVIADESYGVHVRLDGGAVIVADQANLRPEGAIPGGTT